MEQTKWVHSGTNFAAYLGIIEFQSNDDEFHNFEVYEMEDRLVFGGHTNIGFMESGYIMKEDFSTDLTLQGLLEDLETFYNDGAEYVEAIVFNDRM